MIDRDELAAWLRLLLTPRLGRGSARRLLATFGSPQAAFGASDAARRQVVDSVVADAALQPPDTLDAQVADTLAWLRAGPARCVVTLGDAAYPATLLNTADPPLLIFLQGRPELLVQPSVAIVGSRNATPQGRDHARAFAAYLGREGYVVVSGMALGIDAAAHEGALQADAGTIAVVGTGLDRVYPSRHRDLARRIAESGLLLSEFPLGTPALPQNFPMRNRIIAGLSDGTLVVEAALQSGSLITARLAAEAGRDVFAIPGSIHSPQARGCHALIKQGAKLVESGADVVDELRPGRRPAPAVEAAMPRPGDPVLDALGYDPVTLDALIARTGWPAPELSARLLALELDGEVARLPGGLFQRRISA